MLSSTKKFDSAKCQMLIKLALNRLRLHKAKKRAHNENQRREISGLLREGKEEQARIRVINVIHEDYMQEILGMLELYLEAISVRLDIIAAQMSCPLDVKEAVCSVCYATPFLENSPELVKLRRMFLAKYGTQFPAECVQACCVNQKMLSLLSRPVPSEALINFYLSWIANKHQIDWDAPNAALETESLPPLESSLAQKLSLTDEISAPNSNPPPSLSSSISTATSTVSPTAKATTPSPTASCDPKGPSPCPVLRGTWCGDGRVATSEVGVVYVPTLQHTSLPLGTPLQVRLDPPSTQTAAASSLLTASLVSISAVSSPSTTSSGSSPSATTDTKATVLSSSVSSSSDAIAFSSSSSSSPAGPSSVVHCVGLLKVDRKGQHWVLSDAPLNATGTRLIHVPAGETRGAVPGQRVRVQLHPRTDGQFSGSIVAVLSAGREEGVLKRDLAGHFWVVQSARLPSDTFTPSSSPSPLPPVYVAPADLHGATHGDRVVVELHPRTDGKRSGVVVAVLERQREASNNVANVASSSGSRTPPTVLTPATSAVSTLPATRSTTATTTTSSAAVEQQLPPEEILDHVMLTVDHTTGSGYVIHPLTHRVVMIPPSELSFALHGDEVQVRVPSAPLTPEGYRVGQVLAIRRAGSDMRDIVQHVEIDALTGDAVVAYDALHPHILVRIPAQEVNAHRVCRGDLIRVRTRRYWPSTSLLIPPTATPTLSPLLGHIVQVLHSTASSRQSNESPQSRSDSSLLSSSIRSDTELCNTAVTVAPVNDVESKQKTSTPSALTDVNVITSSASASTATASSAVSVSVAALSSPPSATSTPTADTNANAPATLSLVSAPNPTAATTPTSDEEDFRTRTKQLTVSDAATSSVNPLVLGPALVLDVGTGSIKAGLAERRDNAATIPEPALVYPSIVSTASSVTQPLHFVSSTSASTPLTSTPTPGAVLAVGPDALAHRVVHTLHYPIQHAEVMRPEYLPELLRYAWRTLSLDPTSHPVLLLQAVQTAHQQRDFFAEWLFETLHTPALYILSQPMAVLYALNYGLSTFSHTTALIMDLGEGVCQTASIVEGYQAPLSPQRLKLGGRDLDVYLAGLLNERGHTLRTFSEREWVRHMKEEHAYVALDFDAEMQRARSAPHEIERRVRLPDEWPLTIATERFRVAEPLFAPSLLGHEFDSGIQHMLRRAIDQSALDVRTQLAQNIVLAGGTARLAGLVPRLSRELSRLLPALSIRITTTEHIIDPRYAAWLGGVTISQSSAMQSRWISRQDYEEHGTNILNRFNL
jgi:actin